MTQPVNNLLERVLALTDPTITWQARRDLINALETDYRPLTLRDIMTLATAQQCSEVRVAVEHIELDFHWFLQREFGDVSPSHSYDTANPPS